MKTETSFRFHTLLLFVATLSPTGRLTVQSHSEYRLAVEYSKHQYKRYPKRFGGAGGISLKSPLLKAL